MQALKYRLVLAKRVSVEKGKGGTVLWSSVGTIANSTVLSIWELSRESIFNDLLENFEDHQEKKLVGLYGNE